MQTDTSFLARLQWTWVNAQTSFILTRKMGQVKEVPWTLHGNWNWTRWRDVCCRIIPIYWPILFFFIKPLWLLLLWDQDQTIPQRILLARTITEGKSRNGIYSLAIYIFNMSKSIYSACECFFFLCTIFRNFLWLDDKILI